MPGSVIGHDIDPAQYPIYTIDLLVMALILEQVTPGDFTIGNGHIPDIQLIGKGSDVLRQPIKHARIKRMSFGQLHLRGVFDRHPIHCRFNDFNPVHIQFFRHPIFNPADVFDSQTLYTKIKLKGSAVRLLLVHRFPSYGVSTQRYSTGLQAARENIEVDAV